MASKSFTRYGEAPSQPQFIIKQHHNVKARVLSSHAAPKNPQNELLRLPALNSMRRSASLLSTERNTKFKLVNLQQKVEELAADVRNTRLDAQETFNTIHFLTDSLANKELSSVREDLKKQVKGLERVVNAGIASDEYRSRMLRDDCKELWGQTESMRQMLFDLRMRTERLDEMMGFKNPRE